MTAARKGETKRKTLPPALTPLARGAAYKETGLSARRVSRSEARDLWRKTPLLICHHPFTARRLQLESAKPKALLDIMTLFAFAHPAKLCAPSPLGLCESLGLPKPETEADHAAALHQAAETLLQTLSAPDYPRRAWTAFCAREMKKQKWAWSDWVAPLFQDALMEEEAGASHDKPWKFLKKWEETPPYGASSRARLEKGEAAAHLAQTIAPKTLREGQGDYAEAVAQLFERSEEAGEPHAVLAEAGTGIGKTLGYMAPAHLWAARAKKPVWISTYTKALQRQIDREAERFYRSDDEKKERVVIRKGRENYLCLLKLESRAQAPSSDEALFLILTKRWLLETRDGDIKGGDFPAWLSDLIGTPHAEEALTDRRGECVQKACSHYKRCFIERQRVLSRRADLVITNHALVMSRAAGEEKEKRAEASRIVFDEGHHLFEAADSAFTLELSVSGLREFRLWLEGRRQSGGARSGLKARLGGWDERDEALGRHLGETLTAARSLPESGAMRRLAAGNPQGAAEIFFAALRRQAMRRDSQNLYYSLESSAYPLDEEVRRAAEPMRQSLSRLADSLRGVVSRLEALSSSDEDESQRGEALDGALYGCARRLGEMTAQLSMLDSLTGLDEDIPADVVDCFLLVRGQQGSALTELDCAMMRHPLDPTRFFAESVLLSSEGVLITSASLRDEKVFDDETLEEGGGWEAAFMRTGFSHLPSPPARLFTPSPFDYGRQARIFLVGDVALDDASARALAYRDLFLASGGGALGLFTAIRRLRDVHRRIASALSEEGLLLLAQHVDAMHAGALVDMFRMDSRSCLLGTDGVRDGIDVPGEALRLLVFDRVPWPRPDVPHKARAAHFGGRAYNDMLTRLRLRQAFGRLIRSEKDRGVFVLLDGRCPGRLESAFPEGSVVKRADLAEAVAGVQAFFADEAKSDIVEENAHSARA